MESPLIRNEKAAEGAKNQALVEWRRVDVRETEGALKKCVHSNAASELKGSAKKVLQAHGLGS